MNSETSTKLDKTFKVVEVSAKDQMTRVEGIIARHAFLGVADCTPGHELEKWRHAKSELVKSLCYGLLIRDEDVAVTTNIGEFQKGTVEIWVSPRHVTICGISRKGEGDSQEKDKIVVGALDLPVDIEPSAVTAQLNGPILEMCFPKVHVKKCGAKTSSA